MFGFLAILLAAAKFVTQMLLKKNKSANLSAFFYLISGILFILALRGLSSRNLLITFWNCWNGNINIVTFLSVEILTWLYICCYLLIGGRIGAIIVFKIPMTVMPELLLVSIVL